MPRPAKRISEDVELRIFLESVEIGIAEARLQIGVGFAVLDRQARGLHVVEKAHDDALGLRTSRQEEVRVPFERDRLARLEFRDLIWAGANRHHVGRIGTDRTVRIDMLGQDRQQQRGDRRKQRGMGLLEHEARGQRIRRLDLVDGAKHRTPERMVGTHGVHGKGDVFRGDRRAVMEACVLAQVERVCEPVGGNVPGFRKIGLRLELVVELDQPGEHLRARKTDARTRRQRIVDDRRRDGADDECSLILGHGCSGRECESKNA